MKNIFKITALFSIIILNSCTQEKKIFRTDLKDNGDKKTLTYIPNMEFKVIKDSAFLYFNQEDYKRVLSGDIKVGKEIYNNNNFNVKIIVREYFLLKNTQYEIILRTYGNDFRIIDSFTLGSTAGNNYCDGYITDDLKVVRNCDGKDTVIGSISERGKFIIKT